MSESTLINPFPNSEDLLLGVRLGDYEILEKVGVGGMGVVYRGVQPVINKRVAIKVLKPEFASDPAQVQRLVSEAQLVNAVAHRNIIDIFGFGQVPDGRHYIVMEYLEGEALDAYMRTRVPMDPLEVVELLTEICVPLFAAHQAGVIHRDLKPSNIFRVRQADGTVFLKLLDFGLSKRAASIDGRTAQTSMTQVAGTPDYMAPEQARGKDISPATDLYALGVMTWQMLVGRLPFVGETAMDVMMRQVNEAPVPPSRMRSGIPSALDALVLALMAKDPAQRPSSAEAMRAELKRIGKTLQTEAHEDSTHPSFDRLASTLIDTDEEGGNQVGASTVPPTATDLGKTQPMPQIPPELLLSPTPQHENRLGAEVSAPTTEKSSQTRKSQQLMILIAATVALVGVLAWVFTRNRGESTPVVPPPREVVVPKPAPTPVKPVQQKPPVPAPPRKVEPEIDVVVEVKSNPPVKVEPPAKVDPPPKPPEVVRPPRTPTPTPDYSEGELQRRWLQLMDRLKHPPQGVEVDNTAVQILTKRRALIVNARTAKDRVEAMKALDSFENKFLH